MIERVWRRRNRLGINSWFTYREGGAFFRYSLVWFCYFELLYLTHFLIFLPLTCSIFPHCGFRFVEKGKSPYADRNLSISTLNINVLVVEPYIMLLPLVQVENNVHICKICMDPLVRGLWHRLIIKQTVLYWVLI